MPASIVELKDFFLLRQFHVSRTLLKMPPPQCLAKCRLLSRTSQARHPPPQRTALPSVDTLVKHAGGSYPLKACSTSVQTRDGKSTPARWVSFVFPSPTTSHHTQLFLRSTHRSFSVIQFFVTHLVITSTSSADQITNVFPSGKAMRCPHFSIAQPRLFYF